MVVAVVVIAVLGLVVQGAAAASNDLVRFGSVDASSSQIGVQLNCRHDVIPILVETVKSSAAYERETLEAVTSARTTAVRARASPRSMAHRLPSNLAGRWAAR